MSTFRSIEELVKSLEQGERTSERNVCQTEVSFVPLRLCA